MSFADWPELKEVYDAGGFQGMLMAWDADEETQAANLGQWRPDAANPTGLFTPNLGGQFFRNWTQQGDAEAGAWEQDAIRNITGTAGSFKAIPGSNRFSGAFTKLASTGGSDASNGTGPAALSFDASLVVPTGPQNIPQHVWQPLVIYLGRSAQV